MHPGPVKATRSAPQLEEREGAIRAREAELEERAGVAFHEEGLSVRPGPVRATRSAPQPASPQTSPPPPPTNQRQPENDTSRTGERKREIRTEGAHDERSQTDRDNRQRRSEGERASESGQHEHMKGFRDTGWKEDAERDLAIRRRERELEEREKGIRELLSDALDQAKESLARTASTEYTDVEPEKQSGHFGLGILLSHV